MPDIPSATKIPGEHILRSGYFPVGGKHQLYFELWGKRDGQPVVFLHGGPGAGFRAGDHRFFGPEKHCVLFFDQRGAGWSRPAAETEDNRTGSLVQDVLALMDNVSFERASLFGGSWGSTLAILVGASYPHRVENLILRGFFKADQNTIDMLTSPELGLFRPQEYARFISHVPEGRRDDVRRFYLERMAEELNTDESPFAGEWARYTAMLAFDEPDTNAIENFLNTDQYKTHAFLTAFYAENTCFLPDGEIMRLARQLDGERIWLVHGNRDVLCPVAHAHELKALLPALSLHIADGGHASSEPEIAKALIDIMQAL